MANCLESITWSELGKQNIQPKKVAIKLVQVQYLNNVFSNITVYMYYLNAWQNHIAGSLFSEQLINKFIHV